jgi:hypothetical protein
MYLKESGSEDRIFRQVTLVYTIMYLRIQQKSGIFLRRCEIVSLTQRTMLYVDKYESNNSSIAACLFIAAGTYLPRRCLRT